MIENYSYIGVGKVYLRKKGAAEAMRQVGNTTKLSLSVEENVVELKDSTDIGGGTYNENRRIDSVTSSFSLSDYSPENLSMALYGISSEELSGSITDEAKIAYVDGFIKLDKIPDTISDVNDATLGGGTSYTEGTDYEVRPGGIYILSGGSITDGTQIYITYTNKLSNNIQALVNSSQEYEIVFDGLNEARSGKSVIVTIHKQKIGAAPLIDLISDDFGSLDLGGKLLKDLSITGTNLSKYFTVQIEQ